MGNAHPQRRAAMAFLEGSFSCQRFVADKRPFHEYDVEALRQSGPRDGFAPDQDGNDVCWVGGDHELDGEFSCGKNLRGPYLQWAFRVTKFAPPAGRVRAVYKTELKALMAEAGAEVPTADMKREAREAAQARIEEEGKDGRYLKRTVVPVVWDGEAGEVWYGAASHAHHGLFLNLFADTFGVDLVAKTAGVGVPVRDLGRLEPAFTAEPPAWCPDGYDWVGNEFALWCLWRQGTAETVEEVELDSVCPVVGKLTLACPDGVHGTDTFACEVPIRLPEVMRALQAGRLPRSLGLTFGQDVGAAVLDPERWVVTGVKVPELDGVRPGAERELARLDQCRAVFRSVDDLFARFLDTRLGDGWGDVREKINQWAGRVPAGV